MDEIAKTDPETKTDTEKAPRRRGRPPGTVKDGGREKTHSITLSDRAWAKAKKTGNASAYIERLIMQDE